SRSFLPENRTCPALITTTKWPLSRWAEKAGVFFPRNTPAIVLARRPTVFPCASTRYQRRAASKVWREDVVVSLFIQRLSGREQGRWRGRRDLNSRPPA